MKNSVTDFFTCQYRVLLYSKCADFLVGLHLHEAAVADASPTQIRTIQWPSLVH